MDDPSQKRPVLVVAALGAFLTPFLGSAVHVALPALEEAFHLDAVLVSWVATSFVLAAAVSSLPFGRLADLVGRKRIFFHGNLVVAASCLLAALAPSPAVLLAARVGQGVGSGMVFSTLLAIVSSVFPRGERGRAIGITVSSVYAGLSAGPFLGGMLTQHCGWRSVFLAVVPLGAGIAALVGTRLKGEWVGARGGSFDRLGTLLYTVALVAGLLGLSWLPHPAAWALLGAAVLGALGFVRWETRRDDPLLDLRLFSANRAFALSGLAALVHYAATFAVAFLLSLHLQHVKGLSPQMAGLVLLTQPLLMALLSPWAGRLSDRVEPRVVASAGMALTAVALGLLALLEAHTPLPLLVADLALLGVGYAAFSSPNANAMFAAVEPHQLGVASGLTGTMRLLGQMASMAIATLVFTLYLGRVRIAPDNHEQLVEGVRLAFAICATLCVLGVAASLARGRVLARPEG